MREKFPKRHDAFNVGGDKVSENLKKTIEYASQLTFEEWQKAVEIMAEAFNHKINSSIKDMKCGVSPEELLECAENGVKTLQQFG